MRAMDLAVKVFFQITQDGDNRMVVFAKVFRAGKDVGVNLGCFVKMKLGLQNKKRIAKVFVKRATHNIVDKVIDVIFNLTPFDLSFIFGYMKEDVLIQDGILEGFDFAVISIFAKDILVNFNFRELPFCKNHLVSALCLN